MAETELGTEAAHARRLDDVFDQLVLLAGCVLRSKQAAEILAERRANHRVLMWQAFFQAILSPTFGTVTPDSDWRRLREEFVTIRNTLEPSDDLTRTRLDDRLLYTVVQFWNADDERATAFLVNEALHPSDTQAAAEVWRRGWELMAAVNNDRRDAGPMLNLTSLGNFVVRRSHEMAEPCPVLGFYVGSNDRYAHYADSNSAREWALRYLEVPNEIANSLFSLLESVGSGEDASVAANRLRELANAPLWETPKVEQYLTYVNDFFLDRCGTGHGRTQPPSRDEVKVILLNNLAIARPLVHAGHRRHFQYFIPTLHKSTSYLALVSRDRIEWDQLAVYARFVEQLIGTAWVHDSVRKLDQDKEAILERAEQAARAAIMSRNLSHNIGSHVLANPRLSRTLRIDSLPESRRELETFHQYMQARLDYLARAISRQVDRSEPLFLIGDMLSGFFRQVVVLETLLSDRGFPLVRPDQGRARNLKFHVSFEHRPQERPHQRTYTYELRGKDQVASHTVEHETRTYTFELQDGAKFRCFKVVKVTDANGQEVADLAQDDLLIGVPGGTVGCQAMYTLLENVMRNAAKYGRLRNDDGRGLEMYLRLRDATESDTEAAAECYVLEMWDNLSDDSGEGQELYKSTRDVRKFVKEKLILPSGDINTEGHGIQEMKIAAGTLSNGFCFRPDSESIQVCPGPEEKDHYAEFLQREIERIDTPQPLRVFAADREVKRPDGEPAQSLVFQVLIPKACLVGVVCADGKPRQRGGAGGVWYYQSVLDLAQFGAAFGVLLDTGRGEEYLAKSIEKTHEALPFRLLVVTDSPGRAERWREVLNNARNLPKRRVYVVCDPDLHQALQDGSPTAMTVAAAVDGWASVILRVYDRWLRAYKPAPRGRWTVLIGFEREHGGICARWQSQLATFGELEQCLPDGLAINLAVATSGPDGRKAVGNMDLDTHIGTDADSLIVFDNHGNVFQELANTWDHRVSRVYHQFSGLEMSLSQALESPPEDPFSFAWFVYQLVEGSLTEVVILDERFAEATIDSESDKWKSWVNHYSSAGVHAGYAVRPDGGIPVAVSHRVESVLKKRLGKKGPDQWPCVTLAPRAAVTGVLPKQVHGITPLASHPVTPDVIVIHEGIAEDLNNRGRWKPRAEHALFDCTPRIIRTSGRGTVARLLSESHPFIEFSELSEVTYRGLNKPALGRAVLSATGTLPSSNEA